MPPKADALLLADYLASCAPPKPRLTPRQETIDLMLVDHLEVQNTMNSGIGAKGSGWGFQMPATFTRPHVRLDSLLRKLRREGPEYVIARDQSAETTRKLYWWPAEFYLRAKRVQRPVSRKLKHKEGGTTDVEAGFMICVLRPVDFDFGRVREALEWLDSAWLAGFPEQPHYLTGADWERLLNPPKTLLGAA